MMKNPLLISAAALVTVSMVFIGAYVGANEANALQGSAVVRLTAVDFRIERESDPPANHSVFAQKILSPEGNKIGNAYTVCTRIGKGGILGNGVDECHGIYNLPLGKIAVQGSRTNRSRFTFVVTGGSGFYAGGGGSLDSFLSGVKPHRENLIIHIQ